jgi:hypothetical protein
MRIRRSAAAVRLALCTALLSPLLLPGSAAGQTVSADSVQLHGTIRDWAEQTWLLIADRAAADGGRLTNRGILLRFHEGIDDEYALDQVSTAFGVTDTYAWWQTNSGARFGTGSINHLELTTGFQLRAPVNLGRGWQVGVRFDHETTPAIKRNYLRIGFRKDWKQGPFIEFGGSLDALKPDMDLWVGGGFKDRNGEARLSVNWLDAFNDAIYQGLEVWTGFADTAIDYERQSWALRASVERRFGRHFRVEADGALLLPTRFTAYTQVNPDSGFRQEEDFASLGGLVEWTFAPSVTAGAFATWVKAISDRAPLPAGFPEDDYRLTEETTRVGGYALWQIALRWRVETWLAREWRPELRGFRSGGGEDVDYEDRSWRGQAALSYRALSGFRADAAFEMDRRDIIRGDGQVPSTQSVGRHNARIRLEAGWNFGTRFRAAAGYRIDLDGDEHTHGDWYDGAHGRFTLHW